MQNIPLTDSVDDMTRRLFADAGIRSGMTVLDVGCSSGDVSFLLAQIVGQTGHVTGLDRDEIALDLASKRVQQLNLKNISFIQGDLTRPLPDCSPFNAAVARRVIMYLPNPVDAVRRIASLVRPGGIIAFLEHDATMVPGRRIPLPLQEKVNRWIWQTVERENADINIGFALPKILKDAGLTVEHIRAEAIIQTPETRYPTVPIIRAMLPRIIERGVATEAEIGLDTLEQRLLDEREKAGSLYVSDIVFTIWARR